jgi:glutaredoxin
VNVRAALVLSIAALASGGAAAQGTDTVYRSVGPDGRVTYSQSPPASGKVDRKLEFEKLPATPLPAYLLQFRQDVSQAAVAAAPPPQGLRLYSATWCGYCRQARAWLQANGQAFQEVDIDQPAVLAEFRQRGNGGVPLLVGPNLSVRGFRAEAYAAALKGPRKP